MFTTVIGHDDTGTDPKELLIRRQTRYHGGPSFEQMQQFPSSFGGMHQQQWMGASQPSWRDMQPESRHIDYGFANNGRLNSYNNATGWDNDGDRRPVRLDAMRSTYSQMQQPTSRWQQSPQNSGNQPSVRLHQNMLQSTNQSYADELRESAETGRC